MKHLVMKLEGKGSGRADYFSLHSFATIDEAAQFVVENTKPDEKYWSVATVIEPDGYRNETHLEALL